MTWRLAGSLERLRWEVTQRWPGTVVWTIGDQSHAARASDHNPNDEGVVCAIDVVGRDIAHALWHELLDDGDERIAYLIFDRTITSSTVDPWEERDYDGSNPHEDHIHISVGRGHDGDKGRADLYDDESAWGIFPAPSTPDDQEEDDMADYGAELAAIGVNTAKAARSNTALVAAEVARYRQAIGLEASHGDDERWAERIAAGNATLADAKAALDEKES